MKIEKLKIENYSLTVGLEIHVELATQTKMFCNSKNDSDEKRPNVNICPVCLGYPGTLPVINQEAVRSVLRLGLAVGGKVADYTEFDRKNYFYPDIPKGYQISQYRHPLVQGGLLANVAITRIHLEEDTARSIHISSSPATLVDFNRAGVPLMELVTEPVIKTAIEASNFARELQLLLKYLNVSGANMEKGEMRVEANISVRPRSRNDADSTQKVAERVAEDDFLYKDLTYQIRGILFNIRKNLGLGHKEQIYHNALEIELKNAGLSFESKKNISVLYDDKKIGVYQPDFIIEDQVIIELKALPKIAKPQEEQLWSYLKGCSYKLALLVNFGSGDLEIKRVVYDTARNGSSGLRDSALSLPDSAVPLGTKVEIKNLNSFKVVEKAIKFEMKRQVEILEQGERVVQETRGWDENKEVTFPQRLKESAHDYRYFPDPDLPALVIGEIPEFSEKTLRASLPELPWQKRERYKRDFRLKEGDIEIYVRQPEWGRLFEETAEKLKSSEVGKFESLVQLASNYITSDLKTIIPADALTEVIRMVMAGELSSRGAKDILKIIQEKGGEPRTIANDRNLIQESDREVLEKIAKEVLRENPGAPIDFLVGQAMKKTKGKANPSVLKQILEKRLGKL